MTSRFALSVHILGYTACRERYFGETVTSDQLACSINTHPVIVRRLLVDLRKGGLIDTRKGTGGGVRLAKPPEQITLADIYSVVEEDKKLLTLYPRTPNPACIVGCNLESFLTGVFARAEEAMRHVLDDITLAQVEAEIVRRAKIDSGNGQFVTESPLGSA